MQTVKIDTTKMRNDEHFQFMTEFKNAVNKYGSIVSLRIQQSFNQFQTLYMQEDEAFKKIIKSVITAEIQEADAYRDRVFRGMVDTAKAALNHFREDNLAAAKRLKVLFDTYGNLAPKPLNEETSAIYNLLQDLNGKYRSDANKVNLTEWVNELQNANNRVSKLIGDRYDESAAKTDLILKEVRVQIDAVYKTIIERINAFAVVAGLGGDEADGSVFATFIKYFNTVIDKYSVIMAQRYGKKKKD